MAGNLTRLQHSLFLKEKLTKTFVAFVDAGSFESVEPTTSLGQHKFEATRFGEADGPDRSTQHGRDSNGHTCVGNTQISLLLNDQGWQVMVFLGITCASITLRIRWLKSVFFFAVVFFIKMVLKQVQPHFAIYGWSLLDAMIVIALLSNFFGWSSTVYRYAEYEVKSFTVESLCFWSIHVLHLKSYCCQLGNTKHHTVTSQRWSSRVILRNHLPNQPTPTEPQPTQPSSPTEPI